MSLHMHTFAEFGQDYYSLCHSSKIIYFAMTMIKSHKRENFLNERLKLRGKMRRENKTRRRNKYKKIMTKGKMFKKDMKK